MSTKRNPINDAQAIEKIYRVRMYLIGNSYLLAGLTLEQMIARNQAEQILGRIQQMFW
jgi:hypothetical protein